MSEKYLPLVVEELREKCSELEAESREVPGDTGRVGSHDQAAEATRRGQRCVHHKGAGVFTLVSWPVGSLRDVSPPPGSWGMIGDKFVLFWRDNGCIMVSWNTGE